MEHFNANQPILTEPFGDVNPFPLDPIWPDGPGRSEPGSFASPSLLPDQLPVISQIGTGDDMFAGQIQEAIAPDRSPPSGGQPPALADPLIGNSRVVNQEAIASLGRPGNGLKAEYFNPDFTNPVLTRIDPKIDFDWLGNSPDPIISKDNFSGRWTGKLQPNFTEVYTFLIQSDGPVRLWLDGELVIDNTSDPGATISRPIALEAGQLHDFIFEYDHASGDAAVELSWSSASQPTEIIPLSAFFTPETRPDSPDDREPRPLQFITNPFYNPGDTVRFRGKAYAGDTDLNEIDFQLQKDGDRWIDISDATEFVPDRNDPGYNLFDYELSSLEPGRYQLRGTAIASEFTSETVTRSFTVLDLETQLPNSVLQAIARSANLENYSAEELAQTQRWIVNLRVGESSADLASDLGARDLGATGHIPNSFIWEFPADVDAIDAASQLSESPAVQFAYPQVPVKLEPLLSSIFFPKDRFFEEQWHLKNTGQKRGKEGVDANVTGAWKSATGNGVVIGIVDDGLQHTHPDLRDNYRPDLSRDFNEGDIETRNYDDDPAPFSEGLIFEANLEEPVPIEADDEEEIIQYVNLEGTVENLKVTLDMDHRSPEYLEVYLYSPNDTELELIPGDKGNEYTIDPEELDNDPSLGVWTLIIENDSEIRVLLDDWSLILDVWNSHGTPVAGVAAASGDNDLGVTGVAPDAQLAGLRLIAAEGVEDFQIADALDSELNSDIDIYNNSWKPPTFWAGPESLMALHQGATNGRDGQGNIYVFGAGNNGREGEDVNYNAFANSRHTIAVGAIDNKGKKSRYSQQGASLLIAAPSSNNKVGITTTDLVGPEGRNVDGDGEYGRNVSDLDYTNDFGGTSSATPVVSGVNALMLEVNPNLTPRDVQHILVETANRDLIGDEIRHSYKYGFGVVDGSAAVDAAASWTPVPEEVSISTGVLDVGREIPDDDGKGITDATTLEKDITVEWIEVVFDADHELRGDLKIELTSPSGTKSLLAFPWFEFPASDAGYDNWVLTSVRHWGESSEGEWQLQVADEYSDISDEAGTWNSWELNFYGTSPTTVEVEATEVTASEDGKSGEFTFTRTGDIDDSLIVNISVGGTATADIDYEALPGTVEIPAGSSSAQVNVIPKDDDAVEDDETVFVVIDADDAYAIGTNNSATVTIANNPPTLTLIDSLTGAREETSFTISYSDLMAKSDAVDADGDPIFLEISTIASGTLMKDDVPVEPGVTTLSSGEAVVWTPDTVGDEVSAFTVRAFDSIDYSSEPVQVIVAVTALPMVSISATDANASEDGDAGELTVTRSGDATSPLSVNFSIAGDAEAGTDYETIDNIIIPAGALLVKVPLIPIDDDEIEGSQTATVNLETGTGYKLGGDRSSSITIADNDFPNNPPTLTSIETLTDATEETPFTISYAQLRSASNVADADGDAISFQIEAVPSGTLMKDDVPVEPGVTTLSSGEAVVWTPDTVGDEVTAFTVRAFDSIDYSSEPVQVIVAVTALPMVSISATDANASEDGDAGELTVTRSGDTTSPLEVSFSIAGDAEAGTDYETIDNIIIPAGALLVKVPLIPKDDDEIEGSQTATVNLETGTGYKLPNEISASVSIADNDFPNNPPTLTLIDPLTGATEGKSFTISYDNLMSSSDAFDADGDPIFLEISTIASGTLMKNDAAVEPGVTTLSSGETVVWTPDTVGDEVTAFTVRAFDAIDYSSEPVQVIVAVTALPIVTISATDANASEDGDAGELTVARSGDTTSPLEVSFSIAGDAEAGTDYETIDNIIIPAGAISVKVPLIPKDDDEIEGSQTATVNLETGTGYKLGGDRSSSITIADNDFPNNPPTLTLIDPLTGATEGKSFTISYDNLMSSSDAFDADGDPIFLEISTIASGTLMKDDVPVEPGVTTLSEGETVVWTPDTVGDVTAFTVRAFDSIDYSSEPVQVIVAVTALPIVAISATDANASEDGDAGELTVTRSGDTTSPLEVNFSIAGDATAGTDYEAIDNIIIPTGLSAVKVIIDPFDDAEIEENETVVVNLDPGTGYKLPDESSAEVTIADNDFPIDLESLALMTTATSFSAGDNFNARFLAINNGPETAGSFNVAFYLSQDDTITSDDRLLGNYTVSQLIGYRNTGLLFANLTLPDTGDVFWNGDGDYTLGMRVDSDNVISESDEDNNANTEVDKDYVTISIWDTQLNQPPVAIDDASTITQGSTATIDILTNDFDPDGDPLAIIGVSTPASGEVDLSGNNAVYTPNVGFAGADSFIYTVSDGQGGTDTATANVTVEASQIDLESLALMTAATSLSAGDNFNVRFLAINNGPETAGPFNVAFYLSQDDTITSDDRLLGNYAVSQLIGYRNTGLLFANLTLPDTGDVFWNGDGDYAIGMIIDSDNVISESNEDNNANIGAFKDKVTIDISGTQLNNPPVAVDDFANTAAGTSVTIPVVNNDFDINGDAIEIIGVSTATSGEVDLSGNNVVYTPNVGFAGADSFIYTVSDGQGGTDTATVSVTVEQASSTRVTVTVNRVNEIDDMDVGWFGGSDEADFFAELTINGRTWQSPIEKNQNRITPNWQFTQEVSDFTVPITINMYEEDGGFFGGINDVDINPSGGVKRLNLLYDLRTGQVSGDASGTRGEQIRVRGSGDSLRAEMWFTIGSDILLVEFPEDSIPTNHWNAAFIDRTNSNVDDRALYNFSNPEAVLDLGPASGDRKIRLYQNWNASPASGVQSDYFAMSAWTRTNFAADKLYKITTQSDDGIWFRMKNVNSSEWTGDSVVEGDDGADWRDRATWNPPKTIMFKVPETGEYDFYAEFYDRTGEAVVDFSVEAVQFFSESVNESQQWQGQFFWWDRQEGNQPPTDIFAAGGDRNNAIAVVNLGNNTRNDGNKGLSFNWADGLPNNDARLPNENFAILATTETYFEAGRKYQARVRGDDGFQLLAQNQDSKELVYITPENNWAQSYGDHQEIPFTVPSDGQYDVQVQFYEERGDANFDLSWEPVNFTGRTIATIGANLRSGPSTSYAKVGKLNYGTQVTFDKWTEGEFIDYTGDLGTASSLWYRIAGTNNWISAAIVDGGP